MTSVIKWRFCVICGQQQCQTRFYSLSSELSISFKKYQTPQIYKKTSVV